MNISGTSHALLAKLKGLNSILNYGHTKYGYYTRNRVAKYPILIVPTIPPTNPSTVLFGDSLIRGVFPKVIPT